MKPGSIVAACLAVFAGILGFWGFHTAGGGCAADCLVHYLNTLWKTLALFVFQTEIPEAAKDNLSLVFARILAPAATGLALFELISSHLAHMWTLVRLRSMRRHTIVIGHGRVGRSFVEGAESSDAVAVIDLAEPTRISNGTNRAITFLRGDARDASVLKAAAARYARRVFIVAGDDAVNLEILRTLLAVRPPRWFKPDDPLDVFVCIGQQSLVRQLDREDQFTRQAKTKDKRAATITPFAPDRIAAQRFIAEHPLVDLADLRAQRRLHLVIVGWSDFSFEVLELVARLSPYRNFTPPKIDLFAHDPDAVRSHLEVLQPVFLSDGAAPLMELHVHDLDKGTSTPSTGQMRAVEPDGPACVTAVLVSLPSDETTVAVAVAIRERSTIDGRWQGPVFAKLGFDSALLDYLNEFAARIDHAEKIIPIGDISHSCKLEAIRGAREETAKALHEAYVTHRRGQDGAADAEDENLQPWSDLRQTYRISNRRAADHIPIKLHSAGYVFALGKSLRLPKGDDFAASAAELEHLAALEHRSWEIGRRLDGWKPGDKRDDKRRINPALGIGYSDLSEPIKELDRVQVRTIATTLSERTDGEIALRDFPIGLIGHNRVSADEKSHMVKAIEAHLTDLIAVHPNRHFSILTPLAPGSDTILTEQALRILADADVPHRLVVVRTLPRAVMLEDFLGTLAQGGEWRSAARSEDSPSQEPMTRLADHLDAVMAKASQTIIADLTATGGDLGGWASDKTLRQDAYRRANAYIVKRCRAIIAFRDPERPSRPGGTGEALAWARGEAIPNAYDEIPGLLQSSKLEVVELTNAAAPDA